MIVIKKADTSSISIIKELAYIVWENTYSNILSADQLSYMLHLFYDETSLQKQMNDGHQFILAVDNDKTVGFASYSSKDDEANIFKLHKLYVLPDQQGKSIGKILLNHIVDEIKKQNAASLELNVNRYNTALQFYKKNGFEVIKEEDVDIGNGYFMNDFVLRKLITDK
jgi:GNAT superfamily N-acetyltransferase